MFPRRESTSTRLLAVLASCALALLAWVIARSIPLRELPGEVPAIPVRASLALEAPLEAEALDASASAEECWQRFHVAVNVSVQPALLDEADRACVLPVEADPDIWCGNAERPFGRFDVRDDGMLVLRHGSGDAFMSSSVELRLKRSEVGDWSCEAVALDSTDTLCEQKLGPRFWTNMTGRVELGYAEWKPGAHVFVRYELHRPGNGDSNVRTGLVRILAP